MKRCNGCDFDLDESEFNRNRTKHDGLAYRCWACQSAKRQARHAKKYGVLSTLTGVEIRNLYDQQQRKCFHCGKALGKANRVVDHLRSMSRQGTNTLDNIAITCLRCNGERWIYDEMHNYHNETRRSTALKDYTTVSREEVLRVLEQSGTWVELYDLKLTFKKRYLTGQLDYLVSNGVIQQRVEQRGKNSYKFYYKTA